MSNDDDDLATTPALGALRDEDVPTPSIVKPTPGSVRRVPPPAGTPGRVAPPVARTAAPAPRVAPPAATSTPRPAAPARPAPPATAPAPRPAPARTDSELLEQELGASDATIPVGSLNAADIMAARAAADAQSARSAVQVIAPSQASAGLAGAAGIPAASTMMADNVLDRVVASSFSAAIHKLDKADDEAAFFARISDEERQLIRQHATERTYSFGQTVVNEGDPADGVYIIAEGRCRVVKKDGRANEHGLAILESGDMFGEMAKPGEPRTATVRATGTVKALYLDYAALDRLLKLRPQLRGWLSAAKEERAIASLLRASSLFAGLGDREIAGIVDAVVPVSVSAGSVLFAEGDEHGPCYVVKFGRVRLFRRQPSGEELSVMYPREGTVFGVQSCLEQCPREVGAQALTDTLLLAIAPKPLKSLYQSSTTFRASIDRYLGDLDLSRAAPMPLDIAEMSKVGPLPTAGAHPAPLRAPGAQPPPARPAEPEAPKGPPPGSVLAPTDQEPFASADGYFKKRGRRIKAFPFVRQVDETDCGVACMAMICRYYGKRISIGRIRPLTAASSDGTSLGGLCRAAQELGLAARSARVSTSNLDKMPTPAIVHWQGYHWIILLDVTADKVRVADPAIGDFTMPRETFLANWNGFAALFDFTDNFTANAEDKPDFGWVRSYFRPYLGTLAIGLALALVTAGLTMLLPVLSQVIVDRVIVDGAKDLLGVVLITMAAVFVVTLVARGIQGYLTAFVAVRIDAAILDYLSRRLLALPMSYFATRRTGDIQRRLGGARELREMVVRSGVAGILAVVQLVVALSMMMLYSPQLTLLFLGMTPLYLGLMFFSSRLMKPLFAQLEEAYGKYSSDQLDALKGMESVKAASAEAVFRDNLLERFLQTSQQQFRADYTSLTYEGALQGVGYLSQILFLWVGATLAINGELTIGGFVAFQSLVGMANGPIFTALGLWDESQRAQILFNRLSDVFETQPEQGRDRSNLIPVRTLSGGVELRRVGFTYGGPEGKPIVRNVDLKVQPGEMIAIVGRSGSGKTTLVKLLSGLLEPTEGSILFDGVDHRTLNFRDLRRRIGFVLQENHIFAGTILDNIAFGEEPDLERAVAAARAADAHGFISNLPLGYSTRIGETGIKLSGGQSQRIAIARALYKQPSLFIFDEATSALDTESEKAIQNNMANYFAGRTAFVIAHRLSTIRDADRIMVLERGEIVELGTHDELLAKRGLYYELVNKQVEQ
jgi:ABC-type bacteriocin/lantibiotic exporter with double-glycine peptidase domain/CRP-like cAMP-binding protein